MSSLRRIRPLSALALAACAVGTLLVTAPTASASDYRDACYRSVGIRTSANGWAIPARNFKYGSSGVCVREIQSDLASTIGVSEADWPGFIDGLFGPKTDDYVREFQRQAHLDVDGVVGPKTWEALISRTTD
ncbi:peptidoglycan-binding protein [Streptomyces sp. NBC_00160]|uniref:peptidoglycan-binding domain-containing protein n=1 Tax=Streptomyces sp. NBC_00160 TaxID=2903628 RepID=UPI00224F4817|nr:peptidoglycan-binding domain-containing protein [Streptomyces sp. NBC_00160]MCX5307454.1 peptidoglycan-binding protein [Streptomyces sp. NBC_00160]